jgi:hypothetical protein
MHNPNSKYVDERTYPGSDTDTRMHNPIEERESQQSIRRYGCRNK